MLDRKKVCNVRKVVPNDKLTKIKKKNEIYNAIMVLILIMMQNYTRV